MIPALAGALERIEPGRIRTYGVPDPVKVLREPACKTGAFDHSATGSKQSMVPGEEI